MNRIYIENRGIGDDLLALLRRMKAAARRYLKCILCGQAKTRDEAAALLGNLDCVCYRCKKRGA